MPVPPPPPWPPIPACLPRLALGIPIGVGIGVVVDRRVGYAGSHSVGHSGGNVITLAVGLAVALLGAIGASTAVAQTTPIAQLVHVEVVAPEIEGELLLDGAPMPGYESGLAAIALADADGVETNIGGTIGAVYGPARVIAGDYVSIYDHLFSSNSLPRNQRQAFGPVATVEEGASLDFDVPTATLRLELRLNGDSFPVLPGDQAEIRLRRVGHDAAFPIGFASGGTLDVVVLPGHYDVIYSHVSGDAYPQNVAAVIAEGLVVLDEADYVVDVPALHHTLEATLDGAPFPASQYERAELRFEDARRGGVVSFGSTTDLPATRLMIPGTYVAIYDRILGGSLVPRNRNTPFAKGIVVPAPPAREESTTRLDVPVIEITPTFTLDGESFPASQYENAGIYLIPQVGDEVMIGETRDSPVAPTLILPGTYRAEYRRILGGSIVPRNARATVAADLMLFADGGVPIDVQTSEVDLALSLDGSEWPPSAYERGGIWLQGEQVDDLFEIAETNDGPDHPPVRIVSGRYDLIYDHIQGGSLVPRNQMTRIASNVDLESSAAVVVDVPTRHVLVDFSLDGSPFPADASESGLFTMRGFDGGEVVLRESHEDPDEVESALVIEGIYSIDWAWTSGLDVPRNPHARIRWVAVPEPGFAPSLAVGLVAFAVIAVRRAATKTADRRAGDGRRWPSRVAGVRRRPGAAACAKRAG